MIPSLFWASPPCSPVLAKTRAGGAGICPGLLQSGQGLQDGGQAGQTQARQPRRLHTRHWEPHCDLEMGICVFPNSSMFQSKFTPDRDKRGCGGSLHSKRNRRKENKENPRPQAPEGLQTFSQAKCAAKEEGAPLWLLPGFIKPRSAALSGAQLRGPAPQRHRGPKGGTGEACPAQRRSEPFSQPGPGPRRAGAPPG